MAESLVSGGSERQLYAIDNEEEIEEESIIVDDSIIEQESIIDTLNEEVLSLTSFLSANKSIESDLISASKEIYSALSPTSLATGYEAPYKARCLGEIGLSRSSRFLNPFNFFPDLEIDIDLTENLWAPKIPPIYDDIGVERYKDLVKEYKAETVQDIINQLGTDTMNLKYYGLKNRSYKILFEVLKYNKHVKHLDLTNNVIDSVDVAEVLADMIQQNDTLESINLSYCNIGPEQTEIICRYLKLNKTLKELNLAHCNIGDEGCRKLAEELGQNTGIKKIDLSYNNLTVNCCNELGDCIFDNNDLVELNLSGNSFKEPGFQQLVSNLRDNFSQSITYVNFSSCNIGPEHEKSLKILLGKVAGLYIIDLSKNNIYGSVVESIAFGMRRSAKLRELNLGYNPLTPEDIILMIDNLQAMKPSRPLKFLDLTDKYVPKVCYETIEKLKRKRRVAFRNYLCDFEVKGPDQKVMFLQRIKSLCESKKTKDKSTFGAFFYTIKPEYCKAADFPRIFDEIAGCEKLSKDKDFLKGLAKAFVDESKKVNIGLMRDLFLKMYPNTPRPPSITEVEKIPVETKRSKKGRPKKK